jgi:hypothetical protein
VKSFKVYPAIAGLAINDDAAEMTFRTFDHPRVFIFRRYAGEDRVNVLVTGGHRLYRRPPRQSPPQPILTARHLLSRQAAANPREVESLARLRDEGVWIIEGDLTQPSVTAQVPPAFDFVFSSRSE